MNYENLKNIIRRQAQNKSFDDAGRILEEQIFALSKQDLFPLIMKIGTIPEDIPQDSTEEKLYAKTADILLAKCFHELGLSAEVIKKRANCADVFAKSCFHSYSLVADAKTFRLSRTAKNQKDFKVQSMAHWKGDSDYAVLVCPFFHYPLYSSIYYQALDENILLWSWEYLEFLLCIDAKENETFSLAPVWNISHDIASEYTRADKNIVIWDKQNYKLCSILNVDTFVLSDIFSDSKKDMISRGNLEVQYYENEVSKIKNYTREQAVNKLIETLGISGKIDTINRFISSLQNKKLPDGLYYH